jgi:micrococcal nuclease
MIGFMQGKPMSTRVLIVVGLLFALSFGFRYDRVNNVRVKEVESGDSFVVIWQGKAQKVRLLGIDAPDKDEPLHEDAKKALSELILGRKVALRFDNKDNRPEFDTAGRWVCIAYLEKTCLNEEMVKKGLACVDKPRACAKLKNLQSLEDCARKEKLGIWQLLKPEAQSERKLEVYVGWKHDDIFHKAGCRVLDKYKPEDIIVFSSKDEAQEKRKPCPVCMPQSKPSP